ncbi:hypothetical protein [Actinophytocola sp.]|uniref:hypothetical protein n=1 Tax=Actinophytocola sp. TaxID=1872138 RepID=UPI00389A39CB
MRRGSVKQLGNRVAEHNPPTTTSGKRTSERGTHATTTGTNVNNNGCGTSTKNANKPLRNLTVALGVEVISPPQRGEPSRPVDVVVGMRHTSDAIGNTDPPARKSHLRCPVESLSSFRHSP